VIKAMPGSCPVGVSVKTIGGIAVTVMVLALTCCTGGPPAEDSDPMPPEDFLGVWHRDAERREFHGADLYGHINGGAEVFLELGFDLLEVQRYAADSGIVEVELYRMTDPTAALGVYLMKCGAEQPAPGLIPRHTLNPLQLQMVVGGAYVVVNANRAEGDLSSTLVEFARYLVDQLPPAGPGDLFSVLPTENRVQASERVIRGPFTLDPLYTLGEGDILSLAGRRTAVAAEYQEPSGERSTLIVASYEDPDVARGAFDHLVSNLDSYLEVLSSGSGRVVFTDYRDRFGVVSLDDIYIRIHVNLASPSEA